MSGIHALAILVPGVAFCIVISRILLSVGNKRKVAILTKRMSDLGLSIEPYIHRGLHLFGDWHGRRVDIYVAESFRRLWFGDLKVLLSAGVSLEIFVQTSVPTRLTVGPSSSFSGALDKRSAHPVSYIPYDDTKRIATIDTAWATQLGSDADIRYAVDSLFSSTSNVLAIGLSPYAWRTTQRTTYGDIDVSTLHTQLDTLCLLTEKCESLPSPTITDTETELERMSRTDRKHILSAAWKAFMQRNKK